MRLLFSFGVLSVVLLFGVFILFDNISGFHHVPLEKVTTDVPYPASIRMAGLARTCVVPDNSRLLVGHCWFDAQDNEWFWCLPRMIDVRSRQVLSESVVVELFDSLLMDSSIAITGVRLAHASAERCVREQGQDVYR